LLPVGFFWKKHVMAEVEEFGKSSNFEAENKPKIGQFVILRRELLKRYN
jgi:hypothetical protein